jgi:hypothetical protein
MEEPDATAKTEVRGSGGLTHPGKSLLSVARRMTETEKMIQEMNGFFKEIGEKELTIPKQWASELELLTVVKAEYKRRLLQQIPKYRLIPFEKLIPDLFLVALRKRESELKTGRPSEPDPSE